MKLIVGLGNPGCEYENTRHNIGFIFIDKFAEFNKVEFKEKFNGMYAKLKINNQDVILLKPLTYMNLSGECVIKYVKYFKIRPENILVIHDDLDMEVGKIKLKEIGSSGGHNGIKNIIFKLKTENFKRLKIGIGKNKLIPTDKYEIGKFSEKELEILKNKEEIIINLFLDYFKLPFNDLMSKYNRR